MITVDFFDPTGLIAVPAMATTLDGFRAWARSDSFPDRGRIAFIQGKLVIDVSPERYETHLKIKETIGRVIGTLVVEQDLGNFYPDGGFVTNSAAEISNEPDGMFASWSTLESGKLAPPQDPSQNDKYIELVGTPDWICEIVSDSSVEKDTRLLRHAYHKACVAEYWLINARGDEVDFKILVWQDDGYAVATVQDGWQCSSVFARSFQLTRRRDRLGRWRYDLAQRHA